MMDLHTLVEKIPDADILREMISFAAERLPFTDIAPLPASHVHERHLRKEVEVHPAPRP